MTFRICVSWNAEVLDRGADLDSRVGWKNVSHHGVGGGLGLKRSLRWNGKIEGRCRDLNRTGRGGGNHITHE